MRNWLVVAGILFGVSQAACQPGGLLPPAGDSPGPELTFRQQALVGPGLGNLSYSAAELNRPISFLVDDVAPLGHQDTVAMVQGYLMTIYIDGGGFNGSIAFWD